MNQKISKLLICLSTLLLALSCSGNKSITRRFNDRYTDIEVADSCDCNINEVDKNSGRYKPPLNVLLDHEKFKEATNWRLENGYKGVYFINMRSGNNMSLVSKKPIKVRHKNNALTLNFTPCNHQSEFYRVPRFSVNLERRDSRDLNENFDYSAFAYFNYLTSGTNSGEGIDPKTVLKEILEERFFDMNDSDISNDFKAFIKGVNMRYETNFEEHEVLYTKNGANTADEFISELENSSIDISNLIVKEYVLTENTSHRINEEEKHRLKQIFSIHDNLLFKKIDFSLKNQLYDGYLSGNKAGKKIAIEINTDIIRKWDASTQKPMSDHAGNDVIADILVHTDDFVFSNYRTDQMKIDSLCTSISEITGTGILLEFDNAKVVFPQKEISYNPLNLPLNVENYPLFKNISEQESSSRDNIKLYDLSLTNFTGLMVPFANIQLPINGFMLAIKGTDLILNNHFLSGTFQIKKYAKNGIGNEIQLVTDKSPIVISVDDLIDHFKSIGLGQTEIKENKDSITVFFKKELD